MSSFQTLSKTLIELWILNFFHFSIYFSIYLVFHTWMALQNLPGQIWHFIDKFDSFLTNLTNYMPVHFGQYRQPYEHLQCPPCIFSRCTYVDQWVLGSYSCPRWRSIFPNGCFLCQYFLQPCSWLWSQNYCLSYLSLPIRIDLAILYQLQISLTTINMSLAIHHSLESTSDQ